MDVVAALVSDGQAAELVEPGQGPLDHPPVAARAARLRSTPLRAMRTVMPRRRSGGAAARRVIALIGVQLRRALARRARRDA